MAETRSSLSHIKRCLDVSERDIASALEDRETARSLLEKIAKVSRPRDGSAKALVVLARLAQERVEWIDGTLRVELHDGGDVTSIEVLSDLGLGMRERVFPTLKMNAPLEEFARVAENMPRSIAPLAIGSHGSKKLVLKAAWDDDVDQSSVLPPSVSIGDESLYPQPPRKSTKPRMEAVRGRPSASQRAGRKTSKPALSAVTPDAIPARSGKTLRPAGRTAAPPRAHTSTLRPEKGVPPPRSFNHIRIPKAPALPRADGAASSTKRTKSPARTQTPFPRGESKSGRGKAAIARSEPPDEEALDNDWEDSER